ncbi:MAG: tripartite tricarboxylate transporter substrate-binding protein [Geminicoccaceae bacterium]|nr:tripartite tricarboxylate transporter substrate-binding protein [Geminicoccaceae bacterium]MDW8340235.1 tripartite tricarboxylate transporter substrate-binding protein [Geminicoccaceae bacterium]
MRSLLAAALVVLFAASARAAPEKLECLAPAKPGGGFDITCQLLRLSLQNAKLLPQPVAVTYMEGGVGAVAYNHVVGTRPADPGLVVAASAGSALLLAQKKFGVHDENAVRWLAAIGADHGVIVVNAQEPFKSLKELGEALKANPAAFPFGGAGAVGSQDWMKAAIFAKSLGIDPKGLRYAALEGGGAVLTALLGGHVRIGTGDASEVGAHHKAGRVRVLAVLSEQRLPGDLADVPTAREQGLDLVWTTWRGFYMGPKVSDADYTWWVELLRKLAATPEFAAERQAKGLFPFTKIGAEFDRQVKADVARFRELAREAGLL